MRRIAANYIFPINSKPIKNGIIVLDAENRIVEIIDRDGKMEESPGVEFYSGILVPGFVNAHCHLELSHFKNTIEQHTGLPSFIEQIRINRKTEDSIILDKATIADKQMNRNGIVAIGDISNSARTIDIKKNSEIYYHTFVEVFGIDKNNAWNAMDHASEVVNQFSAAGLNASIVPHAPYSVSDKLFELITKYAYKTNATLSMHNQETISENELFISKSGGLFDALSSNNSFDFFYPTGFNSLPSTIHKLPKCNKIFLIHNTYTDEDDIDKALKYSTHLNWVVCPNANLYIENKLPNIQLFHAKKLSICIGTDSFASNQKLSILDEMKTIQDNFAIGFEEILKWASLHGAQALDIQQQYGSIEVGKKPGIVLLENFDFKSFKLTDKTTAKLLVSGK